MYTANLQPKRALRPTNFTASFTTLTTLTNKELVALDKLRQVKGSNIFAESIRTVVFANTLSVKKFRSMVATLLSQAIDNPKSMERVLGTECYESLMALKA